MKKKHHILVDFTALKYIHTGFGQFSLYLGKVMQDIVKEDMYKGIQLTYLVPKNFDTSVFSDVNIIRENSLLKHSSILIKNFLFRRYKLFHVTNQNSFRYYLSKVPMIFTIHDLNLLHDKDKINVEKVKSKIQFAINHSKHITAISKYTKKHIKETFNLPVPIKVIYNGISKINSVAKKPDYINDPHPFLFTIGTLEEKKNFHILPDFLNVLPDYKLFIAGSRSTIFADSIQEKIDKLNLGHRVKLLGEISDEDRNWFYQNCKAFVFPSRLEGFGLPIIEAMSLGKPVFLSTFSCLPEIGGNEAYYFENFEPGYMKKVFLEGIAAYDNDENKKEAIIKHANQFNWKKAGREYMELYKSVLDSM